MGEYLPCSFFIASSADMARRSARDLAPAFSADFTPCCSADCRLFEVISGFFIMNEPLSAIALLNNPFVSGDATRQFTLIEPADCPAMVTLLGSPPKAA